MEAHDCVMCTLRRRRLHYRVSRELFEAKAEIAGLITQEILPRQVLFNNEEFICRPCWQRVQRAVLRQQRVLNQENEEVERSAIPDPEPDVVLPEVPVPGLHNEEDADQPIRPLPIPVEEGPPLVVPEYSRAPSTSARCLFYGCRNGSRNRISDYLRSMFLIHYNYYIPEAARVCQEHLNGNDWDELFVAPNISHEFNRAQFLDIMIIMKKEALKTPEIDFENVEAMHSSDLYFRTGMSLSEFNAVLNETSSLQAYKRPKETLGIYLMKLRTGEPDERLSVSFNMSRRTLERRMTIARPCLSQDFVPANLGFDRMSRDEIISRNLSVPDAIFGNTGLQAAEKKAITILDGTYVYIQKSSNFLFQRLTYSHHKFRNLLKPFMIVSCDGHILDVFGPYAATTSDASIMSSLLSEDSVLHWIFRDGDVFVVDRRFRDSVLRLETCGYQAAIPPTRNREEDQLSTIEANKARLVTLCRWVVEVVNGRIKRDFQLFRQDFFNRAISHMMQDFKIAVALTNRFHRVIEDNIYAQRYIEIINERLELPNLLADYVIENNINRRRAIFRDLVVGPENITTFPRLNEEELILLAVGTYIIKLAYSYYSEHIRQGLYNIQICEQPNNEVLARYGINMENALFLRGKIQSRHTRSRIYYTYIICSTNTSGREAINNYYCSCITGKRTLGCCAHIMSIIWYLGWARHQETIRLPAAYMDTIMVDG